MKIKNVIKLLSEFPEDAELMICTDGEAVKTAKSAQFLNWSDGVSWVIIHSRTYPKSNPPVFKRPDLPLSQN